MSRNASRPDDGPADVAAARSAQMALIRGKDTKPELRVRRALHEAGLRFRLHAKNLPGRPDVVLLSRRIAVFVHGCFWHRDPDPGCKLARLPKIRLDFWVPKLEGNAARDARNQMALREAGWTPVVIWECESQQPARLAEIAAELKAVPVVGVARRSR